MYKHVNSPLIIQGLLLSSFPHSTSSRFCFFSPAHIRYTKWSRSDSSYSLLPCSPPSSIPAAPPASNDVGADGIVNIINSLGNVIGDPSGHDLPALRSSVAKHLPLTFSNVALTVLEASLSELVSIKFPLF